MLGAAVDAEVTIPPVVLLTETEFCHTLIQHIEPFLSLTAADELTDAGDEEVHRGDGLAVVIHTHIESLDILRIVGQEDGALEVLFGQISLVLGLQVAPPVHGILEFLTAFLQNLDRVGVLDLFEFQLEHLVEPIQKVLIHKLIQELDVLRATLQGVAHAEFQKVLDERHIVLEVGKGDLGLDHPELGGVTAGIAVLGAEGGTEGIDVAERHAEGLDVQLSADGEICLLTEKVLGVVDLPIVEEGRSRHIEGGDLEHLACALAVTCRHDGGMYVDKVMIRKVAVDRLRENAPHAEDRVKGIRAGTEIRLLTEKLQGRRFLLYREIGGRGALDEDGGREELEGLLCLGGQDELALDADGGADVLMHDLVEILEIFLLDDDLELIKAGAIRKLDKLIVTNGLDPAAHRDLGAVRRSIVV